MSANAITVPGVEIQSRPWVETLHEWVTTVDHKRLGILYMLYALLFVVFGGFEALATSTRHPVTRGVLERPSDLREGNSLAVRYSPRTPKTLLSEGSRYKRRSYDDCEDKK